MATAAEVRRHIRHRQLELKVRFTDQTAEQEVTTSTTDKEESDAA